MAELVNDEYSKLDGFYVDSSTKFKIRHNICRHEYKVAWRSFQSGRRCPKCSKKYKYTDSDMTEMISNITQGEYTKLGVYTNSSTKFPIRHVLCGHEYEVTWSGFQSGNRCPKCSSKQRVSERTFSNENIVQKIHELVGNEYLKLDSIYINAQTKFPIKHNTCGHEYEVIWNTFRNGSRCPKCSGLMKLTNEDIVERMCDLVSDEYTKLDDVYVNSYTKFSIKHNICGHEYEVNWRSFQDGKRCPKCNQSKGEKFIFDYLTNNDIPFSSQVKFEDCKYKATLPFDFGILSDEDKIIALLEYDGLQHFEPVKAWGGEENLAITQLRDQIKNQYCKDNNIPLLRIRYDEDIEEKLTAFLKEQNII